MGFEGVNVNKSSNGLGLKESIDDGVCLLIVGAGVVATGLAVNTAVELLSVQDAEAIGITPSYDDTNSILAHHHIDEFFRVSPEGNLFVILDDGNLTNAQIKTVLRDNPSIKTCGVVRNAAAAPADMDAYVSGYQTMINELRAENRNIATLLVEGSVFDKATLISAYPDVRSYEAPNVSVVIAQDPIIRAVKSEYQTYAAIGTALGAISVRNVNENIGSIDIEQKPGIYKGSSNYSLSSPSRQRFLSAGLQDGRTFGELLPAEIEALNSKGFIFIGSYNGYGGLYFNDSHTATTETSDYARMENNRVWDKAADLVRAVLLPRVKSNLAKDPQTGFIREIDAKELEIIAEKALERMISSGEISGASVYVNPSQVLTSDTPLVIKGQLVFNNIIHEITFDLGLTNKIS